MWILVDQSNLGHRARHSLKRLQAEDIPTGVLFGFFHQLYDICSNPRFVSNKVVVLTDSKKSYRKKAFPGYKEKRHKKHTPEEIQQIRSMHEQMKILRREVLPAMGVPVYGQKGLEADDLLSWLSIHLTKKKQKGIMVTNDGDLLQSVTNYVGFYDPQTDTLHNPQSVLDLKRVTPEQWAMVKAIGGCTTDEVPGIRGCSEKGAVQFLHDEIPHHHKKYQDVAYALESGEIEKWKELVVLPHERTRPIKLREPDYNPDVFFDFCKEYDIDSYLEGPGRRKWEMFFEGKFPGMAGSRRRRNRR